MADMIAYTFLIYSLPYFALIIVALCIPMYVVVLCVIWELWLRIQVMNFL